MKTIFYSVLFCLFVFSCKKQGPESPNLQPASFYNSVDSGYLSKVQAYLKKNMPESAYDSLNWDQALLSKEKSGWYLRLAYAGQFMSERFLLLCTDSLGAIANARNISLKKDPLTGWMFNGTIDLKDLQGRLISRQTLVNGYVADDRIRQPGKTSVNSVEDNFLVPAPVVQTLPEVLVVGYTRAGMNPSDYLSLSGLSGGSSGGAGSATGTSSGGSGGSGSGSGSGAAGDGTMSGQYAPIGATIGGAISSKSSPHVVSSDPVTISLETSYSKPALDLPAWFKCFSVVPDAGANYTVRLFVDLPVDDDPMQIFNELTGAVGHCFLGLTKTGSDQTVTQYFGFTSTRPFSAITGAVTPGKVVDNGGHKYNATYAMPVTAGQFAIALNSISKLSGQNYDLNHFNCVDFALSVVNSFQPTTPVIPAIAQMPGGSLAMDTPQGLYISLQHIQNTGGDAVAGNIWQAGTSHGACN